MPIPSASFDPPVSDLDRAVGVQLVRRHVVGRGPRRPEPRPDLPPTLSVAAVVATAVTAVVLAGSALALAASAVQEWSLAGSAGLQDPDLHGLATMVAGVRAVVTGVVALVLAVATVRQTRLAAREGAVRLAAVVHLVIALWTLPGCAAAGGPAVVMAALLGLDAIIVCAAAVDRRCRAWCRPDGPVEPR